MPRAVAVNSRGEVFVSEYGAVERVQRFRLKRSNPAQPAACEVEFLGGFGHAGTGPGEFNRPEGLCVDVQDRLYVADSCNHRIQVFSSDGHFLRAYGRAGKGLGELSYPYDVCVDRAGRQYVCEFGNSRLQVFDANDRPIEIIGGPGAEPGRFANPWGLALDCYENLYVADSQNHRVQKLVRNATTIAADQEPFLRNSDFGLLSAFAPLFLGFECQLCHPIQKERGGPSGFSSSP
jgi:sugar lactone lactonase YvrE